MNLRAFAAADPNTPMRQRNCGAVPNGDRVEIRINEGSAYYTGLETCGNVWLRLTDDNTAISAPRSPDDPVERGYVMGMERGRRIDLAAGAAHEWFGRRMSRRQRAGGVP